ncbi:MAG: hypothetical protein OSB38_32440 [Paraburkholderia fungorum]|nr:hypothetical protein [Paraburkholderia fungorum]
MVQITEERITEIFDAHKHRVEDCDSGIDDDNLQEFVSAILGAVQEESRAALALMDKVDVLIRWAAVSHPDPAVYKEGAEAFWKVCHMLAGSTPASQT